MDAQEIKTAVAHQDAARTAAEAPFVNLADPARALGANGSPATPIPTTYAPDTNVTALDPVVAPYEPVLANEPPPTLGTLVFG